MSALPTTLPARARAVDPALWALVAACLCTSAWIDLEAVWGDVNVPVADLAALAAAVIFGLDALAAPSGGPPGSGRFGALRLGPAGSATRTPAAIALPAPLAYGAFLGVSLAGLVLVASFTPESARFLVRKSLFTWLVYGGAVAGIVARLGRPGAWHTIALVAALCLALPCLWAAVPPLFQGWASTAWPVPPLTSNHKALAVALAPLLPFLWAGRGRSRAVPVVIAVSIAAVALSMSKTAWMTAAFGLLAVTPLAGRPLAARPVWALGAVGALAVGMIGLPFLSGNPHMLDAFDSRMSLNLRAWEMFSTSPWLGAGPGTSTLWEMGEAPHWRINGVEAHGVVQKVAAEQGVLGLASYGAFAAAVVAGLWRAAFAASARPEPLEAGACAMGLALFANLLFSTEAFTSSHWAPLAVALGIARIASTRGPSA